MAKIKILTIIESFFPYYTGAGIFLFNLSKELLKHNKFDITILTSGDKTLPSNDELDGIKIIRRGSFLKKKNTYLFMISGLWYLFFNLHKFDICYIIGDPNIAILARILCKIYKVKIVTRTTLLNSDDPLSIKRRKSGFLRYRSFLLSDAFIAISHPIMESFIRSGININKVYKIPNMVNTYRFKPLSRDKKDVIRQKLKLPLNRIIIISVGAVIYRKGWDILLKAFKKVNQKYNTTFLLGVGPINKSSEYVSNIQKYIKKNNLINDILFVGEKDNIEKYMQASDIFVFPSRKEGFSTVIIEAMATGLPCIISELDGVTKNDIFIEENCGIIVNSYSPEDYAEAILDLMNDFEKRKAMSLKSRKITEQYFSIKIVTKEYAKLFKQITGQSEQ